MARCWIGTVDVERLEDVVTVSRTSWTRGWTLWKIRGSIEIVVDPKHVEVNQGNKQ